MCITLRDRQTTHGKFGKNKHNAALQVRTAAFIHEVIGFKIRMSIN